MKSRNNIARLATPPPSQYVAPDGSETSPLAQALAHGDWARAHDLLAQSRRAGFSPEELWLSWACEAHVSFHRGFLDDAALRTSRCLRALPPSVDDEARSSLELLSARIMARQGRRAAARKKLSMLDEGSVDTQALSLVLDADAHDEVGLSSNEASSPQLGFAIQARRALAAHRLEQARVLAHRALGSSPIEHREGLVVLASIALELGQPGESRTLAGRAAREAVRAGDRPMTARCRLIQARALCAQGRPRRAMRAVSAGLGLALRMRDRATERVARLVLVEVLAALGDGHTAHHQADLTVLLTPPGEPAGLRARALMAALEWARAAHRETREPELLDQCVQTLQSLPSQHPISGELGARLDRWRGSEAPDGETPPESATITLIEARIATAIARHRPEVAARWLDSAPTGFVRGPVGRFWRAYLLGLQGHETRALILLGGATGTTPADVCVGRLREWLLGRSGRPAAAQAERTRWLEVARPMADTCLAWFHLRALMVSQQRSLVRDEGPQEAAWADEIDLGLVASPDGLVVDVSRRLVRTPEGQWVSMTRFPRLFEMLLLLAEQPRSRRSRPDVYTALWKTTYDPEIHDQKVIKTAQRLRAHLGRMPDGRPVLEMTARGGIGFCSPLSLVVVRDRRADDRPPVDAKTRLELSALSETHYRSSRQLRAATGLGHTVLAQDLTRLVAAGWIERTGRGCATRYRLARPASTGVTGQSDGRFDPRPVSAGSS